MAIVRAETKHSTRLGLIKNLAGDRLYLVISGSGTFSIDGDEQTVNGTDLLIFPRGTPYDYWGRMSLLLVPANVDEADIDLGAVWPRPAACRDPPLLTFPEQAQARTCPQSDRRACSGHR